MIKTLLEMLSSKKAVAAIVAVIISLLGRLGLSDEALSTLSPAINDIIMVIMAYIVGQGVADIGKERAKIENGA